MNEALNQVAERVQISQAELVEFCRQHHIKKLSLFGSVLRDDFTSDSDVDVLVEFEPEHVPGFFRFVQMQFDLGEMMSRDIDLHTPKSLSRYFRSRVMHSAEVIYEKDARE